MAENLFCATWGELRLGEYKHDDCVVIITPDNPQASAVRSVREGLLPAVCECECITCKRAWWKDGRPLLNEAREIVRAKT